MTPVANIGSCVCVSVHVCTCEACMIVKLELQGEEDGGSGEQRQSLEGQTEGRRGAHLPIGRATEACLA